MAGNGIFGSSLDVSYYDVFGAFGGAEYTSLISGYQWGGRGSRLSITYSFPGQNGKQGYSDANYSGANEWSSWYALNDTQISNVKLALYEFEKIANVEFVEVIENSRLVGDLRFAFTDVINESYWGWAYLPGGHASSGDVWISSDYINASLEKGSYDFLALMHEIGHAIGLKHPHDTNEYNNKTMQDNFDTIAYTIMSYDQSPYYDELVWPMSLGFYDDQALDALYGENPNGPSGKGSVSDGVHRFFNPQTGGHFFSISDDEIAIVKATRPDLKAEGVGFGGFATDQGPTTEEVYRFYNTKTGGHFFTISKFERDTVIATSPDYKFEGIGFYNFSVDQGSDTSEVYRFLNTKTGGHFFTASEAERDAVIASHQDYKFEGIAFFAPGPSAYLLT